MPKFYLVRTSENSRKLALWVQKKTKALQNAVFYIVGKQFSLRGGAELRNLKRSQIVRFHNPERYVYHEHDSKNSNSSFRKLSVNSKVVSLL